MVAEPQDAQPDPERSTSERIGALAQNLMEEVEREHPGAELEQLVILAALADETDGEPTSHVQVVAESPDLSLIGLLTLALDLVKGSLGDQSPE